MQDIIIKYEKIPLDVSHIILGKDRPSCGMLVVNGISLFNVIRGMICYTEVCAETCNFTPYEAFNSCIGEIFDYIQEHRKRNALPNVPYIDVYTAFKKILTGESATIPIAFLDYADKRFGRYCKDESINTAFLRELVTFLKYKCKKEDIYAVLKHSYLNSDRERNIELIKERQRKKGLSEYILLFDIYHYAYVEGIRAERKKKKEQDNL